MSKERKYDKQKVLREKKRKTKSAMNELNKKRRLCGEW